MSVRFHHGFDHHGFEETIGLLFVFLKRVSLAIASKANTVAEMIHALQVILPSPVNDLQENIALKSTEVLCAKMLELCVVVLHDGLGDMIYELVF